MARPRSSAARESALNTTVDLLFEAGVDGVTLEEVAARSGVARSTLYRHFGCKESLVADAASCCIVEHPTPDTGSLIDDLRFLFLRFQEDEEASRIPELLSMIMDASRRNPELAELRESLMEEKRRPLRTVLRLAQHRGEIHPEMDLDHAIAIIVGPFTHRRLIDGEEITVEFVETILTSAIAGLHATSMCCMNLVET